MQGVLLAAGEGQRLCPHSLAIPKCLMPVSWNNRDNRCEAMIEKLVGQMKYAGIEHIIVIVGYLKDAIMNFLGDGHRFNVAFTYLYQESLLGEADALYLARRLVNDTIIVADTDNYIDVQDVFLRLMERHRTSNAVVTIGISQVPDARQYAIVKVDEKFMVEDLVEKPNQTKYWSNLAKTGLYVIDPTVFDIDRKYTLSSTGEYTTTELFKYLASQKKAIAAEILEALYADMGSWAGYRYVLSNLNLNAPRK